MEKELLKLFEQKCKYQSIALIIAIIFMGLSLLYFTYQTYNYEGAIGSDNSTTITQNGGVK